MHINRSAFLLLTGAIAGSACVISSTDDDNGKSSSSTGASTGSNSSSATVGSGGSGTGGGAGGGACNDDIGAPGDCAAVATTCVDTDLLCNVAKTYFKPKVAENAVACMLALADTADCVAILECRKDALAQACEDSTADQLCTDLITTCNAAGAPLTEAECHALVDGMNDTGRQAVASQCGPTSEGLCFGGLAACVDALF